MACHALSLDTPVANSSNQMLKSGQIADTISWRHSCVLVSSVHVLLRGLSLFCLMVCVCACASVSVLCLCVLSSFRVCWLGGRPGAHGV